MQTETADMVAASARSAGAGDLTLASASPPVLRMNFKSGKAENLFLLVVQNLFLLVVL
jgi:hypothetical protein